MFDATLRSDAKGQPAGRGMTGRARIVFGWGDGRTRLADLYQSVPMRVFLPDVAAGQPPLAVLVTTSGGIVGGDRLEVDIAVEAGCDASAMAQAAEKVYRSAGQDSHIRVRLRVGADGWLDYLPQETILFDGARVRRETEIEAEPGAVVLTGEILVYGRLARGERMKTGLVRDAWSVRRGGRLVWSDALHMDGDIAALLDMPACLDGAACSATMVLVADRTGEHLEDLRAILAGTSAATVVNGVLVARWLSSDPVSVRLNFQDAWRLLKGRYGWDADMPALWRM